MANPRIPYRLSSARAPLPPLDGKRILVHLVVNVENWQFDQPMPRTIVTPPHGRETVPDVPNFSWADYGMRAGLPRILEGLCVAQVAGLDQLQCRRDRCLSAGRRRHARGRLGIHRPRHASEGHQSRRRRRGSGDRAPASTRSRASPASARAAGCRRDLRETVDTPDILKRHGIDYVCDWVVDDRPSWMTTTAGPLIAMPYNLEINDSIIYADRAACDRRDGEARSNSRCAVSSRSAATAPSCWRSACIRI